jgi:hypothetical protein
LCLTFEACCYCAILKFGSFAPGMHEILELHCGLGLAQRHSAPACRITHAVACG